MPKNVRAMYKALGDYNNIYFLVNGQQLFQITKLDPFTGRIVNYDSASESAICLVDANGASLLGVAGIGRTFGCPANLCSASPYQSSCISGSSAPCKAFFVCRQTLHT